MKGITRSTWPTIACISILLSGCGMGSINVWPFNRDSDTGQVAAPANATEYRCNKGSFYLRNLTDGAVWVIYPDRQIRLDKVGEANTRRYSNGIATLAFEGTAATLNDGPAVAYSDCTPGGAGK